MGLCHSAKDNTDSSEQTPSNSVVNREEASGENIAIVHGNDIDSHHSANDNTDLDQKEPSDTIVGDNSIDLGVYTNDAKGCDCNGKDIENCISFKRMSTGLKYYSLLDIIHNKNDEKIFTHFIAAVYDNEMVINDYIHIICEHNHQIPQMKQFLIQNKIFDECDVSKCTFTSRHHGDQVTDGDENTLDPLLDLAKQRFDSLHFYLFHLFECGLRSMEHDDDDDMKGGDTSNDDPYKCFDARFAQLITRVNETRANTEGFGRLQNNQKFNLQAQSSDNNQEQTFLDHLVKNLVLEIGIAHMNHHHKDALLQLKYLMDGEEYDTDAAQYDIDKCDGNICGRVENKKCVASIKETMETVHLHSSTFSIGFRFYYWSFYMDKKQMPPNEQRAYNVDDHSGYDLSDLCVKQKYSSFKEEISNYRHLSMNQYQKVVVKADSYKECDIVRKTQYETDERSFYHYDIAEDSTLGYEHLISLTFYTDYSDLSTDFSGSFRKTSAFEPLSLVKRRNREYWWLSKLLRETVECFGENRDDDTLYGPFYCGMSCVMIIPEFNIRLYSATSTSKQIAVAMKFSGPNGMLLQLNNDMHGWLRAFDCSWMSRYPEEDERLFFGGYWRIKVDCIRIIETQQNFQEFAAAAYYLDAMIT
eukprot:936072_1